MARLISRPSQAKRLSVKYDLLPPATLTAECIQRFDDDADVHAIAEAATAAILDGGGFGWVKPPKASVLEQYFRGVLLVPERALIVGRMDGIIYGAAQLLRPSRNNEAQAFAASVMHNFVAPYARGHGLARLIIHRTEELARGLGYHVPQPGRAGDAACRHRAVRGGGLHLLGHAPRLCQSEGRDRQRPLLLQDAAEVSLILYPAIDLKDGACVRLKRGEMAAATVYAEDPGAQAARWQELGFAWVHVVDLNGAFAGRPVNGSAVRAILAAVTVPVQLGGGIRDMAGIEAWLAAGIARVILGSAAAKNPALVREAAARFPGQVAVGIDARDGMVATEGWAETSGLAAVDLAVRLQDAGVAAIIYTDIARERHAERAEPYRDDGAGGAG